MLNQRERKNLKKLIKIKIDSKYAYLNKYLYYHNFNLIYMWLILLKNNQNIKL